jgi:hypothetical protein
MYLELPGQQIVLSMPFDVTDNTKVMNERM